jgi:predicted kinase
VILDGTHRRAEDRQRALDLAKELGVSALIVELRLSDDAALTRVLWREREKGDTTEPEAYRRHIAEFEPVSNREGNVLRLDGSQNVVTLAAEIEDALPSA